MCNGIQRWIAGGLLGAQILLLAVVPSADARLQAEAVEAHASGVHVSGAHTDHAAEPSVRGGGSGASAPAAHASHPSHDHQLCELCRALSVLGGPGPTPKRAVRLPDRRLGPDEIQVGLTRVSSLFLPVGPRAPPVA